MKGPIPQNKQITGSSPEHGSGSIIYAPLTAVGIAGLLFATRCGAPPISATPAVEQKDPLANMYGAKELKIYSSENKDLTEVETKELAYCNASAITLLNKINSPSTGLTMVPSNSTKYEYSAKNDAGDTKNIGFCVSSVYVSSSSGGGGIAKNSIITFRDDKNPNGEYDSTTQSFLFNPKLPESIKREDIGGHAMITLKTADGKPFMTMVYTAEPDETSEQLLASNDKLREVTTCNLVTGNCVVVSDKRQTDPTATPQENVASIFLLQSTGLVSRFFPPDLAPEEAPPTASAEAPAPTTTVPMVEVTDAKGNKISVPDILRIAADPTEASKEKNAEMVKILNSSVKKYADTLEMAGLIVTPEQITKGLSYTIVDNNGTPAVIVYVSINPDPSKQNELFEGATILLRFNGSNFETLGLNDFTSQSGIKFGIAVQDRNAALGNPRNLEAMVSAAGLVTTEDGLELRYVWPSENALHDFRMANKEINFGVDNGKVVRGQVLIEPTKERLPKWLITKVAETRNSNLSIKEKRDIFIDLLVKHINAVVPNYGDKVDEWVASNEAFNWDGNFRADNFWNEFIGTNFEYNGKNYRDYVELALDITRQKAPENTKLILNEPDLEIGKPLTDKFLKRIKTYMDDGYLKPGDGIGMQFHLYLNDPDRPIPSKDQMISLFSKFADLGLTIDLTELDIKGVTRDANGLNRQASIMRDIFEAAETVNQKFGRPVITSITTWGFHDGDSWLGPDESGLLFSSLLQQKPGALAIETDVSNQMLK